MAFEDDVVAVFPEFALDISTARMGTSKLAVAGTKDGVAIVVKVLRDPLPDQSVEEEAQEPEALQGERFRREILAMRRIASPRVVRILDGPRVRKIGTRKHLWYVEPRYPRVLRDAMAAQWSAARVIDFLCGVLEGLIAMQGAGQLVHRDLKPENLALDGADRPVLLDLGAVLFAEMTTYTVGLAPHTRQYAAPEQTYLRRGGSVDIRADMFAVGVTAYELLVGELPFGNYQSDPTGYLDRLGRGEWNRQRLNAVAPGPVLIRVIDKILRPRANQRFRKLAQFRAALGCI